MRVVTAILAAVCSIAAPLAFALTPSSIPTLDAQHTQAIDTFVASEMARQKIPGLSVGVYSRGQILLAKGYGLASVELNVPVNPETLFQSASVGKQFVTAAVMMRVEEGKLSLDDSITKYFPDAPATWKPILIRNLLSHTSGLSEYESGDRIGPKGAFYLRLDFTEDELATKIEALPIEWAPGEKWAYRNTSFRPARHRHPQGHRQALCRISQRTHLQAPRHGLHAPHQRKRHHPQSLRGLRNPRWPA